MARIFELAQGAAMKSQRTTFAAIETLESRIAPAAVFTFTDVDGDLVTIKTSKGTDAQLSATISSVSVGMGTQIRKIDLSQNAAVFDRTDLSVTVVKKGLGDGLVNIGYIDATDAGASGTRLDLGAVSIAGDLGQIDCGDADSSTLALKSLKVRSLGANGLSTQGGSGDLASTIRGGIGSVTVAGDIRGASISAVPNGMGTEQFSTIGNITIGGSLLGGATGGSGSITAASSIGTVKVGRDIVASTAVGTGGISSGTGMGGVSVGGSILGGYLSVSTGSIGLITIGGDLAGNLNSSTGFINATKIAGVTIKGSLLSGFGSDSGSIRSNEMGFIKIGGDVAGGLIDVTTKTGNTTIGGSVMAGNNGLGGRLDFGAQAGAVKIGGSLIGGSQGASGNLEFLKLASLTILGDVIGQGDTSGYILGDNISGFLKIGGSVLGGNGSNSGSIIINDCPLVAIGGSLVGGVASNSTEASNGQFTGAAIGTLKIGGSIIGGNVTGSANLSGTGAIQVDSVKVMSVGGSIVAGSDTSTGFLSGSGSITAYGSIGSLTVKGNIEGSSTHRVNITASENPVLAAKGVTEWVIGKLAVGGSVARADINAGDSFNPNASIGAVTVGGDWIASSLVAGVKNLGQDNMSGGNGANADNVNFGDTHDVSSTGSPVDGIIARIASISIKGTVAGTAAAGDHFGFVSQQIGAVKIGGTVLARTSATDAPFELSPTTGDVTVREI